MSEEELEILTKIRNNYTEKVTEINLLESQENLLYDETQNLVIFDGYNLNYIECVFQVNQTKDAYILLSYLQSNINTGRRNSIGNGLHLVGFKKLTTNFARIFIRPQTFEDSINDFFNPTELKFKENPKFSKQFYIHSNNEMALYNFLNSNRVTNMLPYKDLILEVNEFDLFLKFPMALDEETFSKLINLLKEL
ncbi:MAG: hypothetical protein JNL75_02935 [Chitinophagales bacterium]|nr:hypothetical protein [Chitinophagales bacterium]